MYRFVTIIAVLLFSVTAVRAETARLSLTDAIRLALENNNRIKAAKYSSEATQQGIEIANSHYLPAITFEETAAISNSPSSAFIMKLDEGRFNPSDFANPDSVNHPAARHDFKTAVSIQQPLFVPSISSLKDIAATDSRKSEIELEATRQNIAFQVFYTYLEVQKATARIQATVNAVTDARENMRLATVRTAAGVGLRSDELRARTHLSSVEQQQITANNNLTLARMKLVQLLGVSDDATYEISGFTDHISVPTISEQVIGEALLNRVEIRQSLADVDKSSAKLRLADSGFLPTVGAFASYQLNAKDSPFSSDNDAWSAGVSLKWSIFDGFRHTSERRSALFGQSSQREMLESTTKEIKYQLRESYVRRDETGKRLEVIRHSVLDAEETVRLLSRRYENSLATMVELLDAQTVLNMTRADLIESEAGHALAGGRVYYMMGTFVKEMLK